VRFLVLLSSCVALITSCSSARSSDTPAAAAPTRAAPPEAPTEPAAAAPPAAEPAPAPAPPVADPGSAPPGTDFAVQVRTLFRVAACGSDDPVPEGFAVRLVDAHCKEMQRRYQAYRTAWADRAGAFIAKLRPADLPGTVVYPFGGGDLTSALVVFPDATEITTISLEAAGDVRAIEQLRKDDLARDLDVVGADIQRLFRAAHSTTKSLQGASHSKLPGTLMFALAALAAHDFEPVSLRYFAIEPDGSLRYLTGDDLDKAASAASPDRGPRLGKYRRWVEQESPFANVEIGFRKRGDASAPVRVFRHILANLDDAHQGADPRLIAHLEKKGKVAAMTKAASFLLWWDDFSIVRDYLLGHIAWMISDASGLPPSYAQKAGLEQITYGKFVGPYFIQDPRGVRTDMIRMWAKQPYRPLEFRFGYPDAEKNHHLMITRPAARP